MLNVVIFAALANCFENAVARMPLYFFDVQDQSAFFLDEEGTELATDAAARSEAMETLSQLIQGKLLGCDNYHFVVWVRDFGGDAVYRAQLTLQGEWARAGHEG